MSYFKENNIMDINSISRETARKSTSSNGKKHRPISVVIDSQIPKVTHTEIVDFDNELFLSLRSHKCTPDCLQVEGIRTELAIKDMTAEFRDVSDLRVPLLLGWKRSLQRIHSENKSPIKVVYEAPCGKIFKDMMSIKRHLIHTESRMDIDYFTFEREINLYHDSGISHCYYYIQNIAKDPTTNVCLERKFVSVMNSIDRDELPKNYVYRSDVFPHPELAKKSFSMNQDFKSACDCMDDCMQRATCHCHKITEQAFGISYISRGTVNMKCQYNFKRLMQQVSTGLFECNGFCQCSWRCNNRVVQNGMRFRLQITKTLDKGWGVITLDDIPTGAFICTYSAELLDDADLYGESDMYYADLDYISVNEKTKLPQSEEENNTDEGVDSSLDDDLVDPTGRVRGSTDSDRRSLRRKKRRHTYYVSNGDCNFKSIHEILQTGDYTLDAKEAGNVGRFFNHSCNPNAIAQNVFVETHDLRFPVVAFFAIRTIYSGNEITWNYNYRLGSIEGRRIDCMCGALDCRGRIL